MMIKPKSTLVNSTFFLIWDYAIETIDLKTDDMIAQMIMTNSPHHIARAHCNSPMYNLE